MLEQELILQREKAWLELRKKLKSQFGKAPDLNALLMLIGIRELGQMRTKYSKEEKQDLMHIATCKLLSEDGYYALEHLDQDGWPHWKALKPLPPLSLSQQEDLLKERILIYFESMEY